MLVFFKLQNLCKFSLAIYVSYDKFKLKKKKKKKKGKLEVLLQEKCISEVLSWFCLGFLLNPSHLTDTLHTALTVQSD